MDKICDHKSVGMIVWKNGKLLLIERAKFPFAWAPPAGHLDGNENFAAMAKIELFEEAGLTAKSLKLLGKGRKENPCRRIDGSWHYWQIFEIAAEGELNRSLSETKQLKWAGVDELKKLAKRTEQYEAGEISEDDWRQNPGLESVWRDWFGELKII